MTDLRAAGGRAGAERLGVTPPPSPRRRRVPLAVSALLAAVATALAFGVLWLNAGDRVDVLVLARDVTAGTALAVEDLAVARLAPDPAVRTLPGSERGAVIGQPVTASLPAGTVLSDRLLGPASTVGPGEAVVGLSLSGGETPSVRLAPGDAVEVIVTAPAAEAAQSDVALGSITARAAVHEVAPAEDGSGDQIVTLRLPRDAAAQIAGAAAADRVRLALVAP